MIDWFVKNLGDAMLAGDELDRISDHLASTYSDADCPVNRGAFIRHESEGRLHCELVIYFSPAFTAVAQELDAQPCPRPVPEGLGLLFGSEACWTTLFPERFN